MQIEWARLRTWNGSQATGFEELVCQLVNHEIMAPGASFIRKGAPDAGVECFWKLASGVEHGWQAKFFTSPPSNGQWSQIDSSVKTALEKHPDMTRYTVCLATDRSDARVAGETSFLDRWIAHVARWNECCSGRTPVEFTYWGTHEIAERLAREEHRGRYYFWFQKDLFSQLWFQHRLEEALAIVGPRYTPELNVHLPVSAVFEGLSRSPELMCRFRASYGAVGKAWQRLSLKAIADELPEMVGKLSQSMTRLIATAKSHDNAGVARIDWNDISKQAADTSSLCVLLSQELRKISHSKRETAQKQKHELATSGSHENFDYECHQLGRISSALSEFRAFARSDIAEVANTAALLLMGAAGTGKTHLFSDAARLHVEAGAAAVLVLGNQLRDEDPWTQIIRGLGLTCTREEFLGALEAAGQLSQRRSIVFIDALNEGEGRWMWTRHLPSILVSLARYPWIGLAVSCRDTYERSVIPDWLVPDKLTRVVHLGFADHEYEATKAYFEYYRIALPAVPMLNPEFQNPLFLRCFCRSLSNAGLASVPPGIRGISAMFDFFLSSVNEKLASPLMLDYDPRTDMVVQTIRLVTIRMSELGARALRRDEVRAICDQVLPGRAFEHSLFRHLLSEGILAETVVNLADDKQEEMVTFSYERLADHLLARTLLDKHVDRSNPSAAFGKGGALEPYFGDTYARWRHRGLLDAIAIQCPELLAKEIYELIQEDDGSTVQDAFVESLLWRDPKTISDKCFPYINAMTRGGARKFLNALLVLAPHPEHPFNAEFLHKNLLRRGMAERDAGWSTYLYREYSAGHAVDRLVDWASSDADKGHISNESFRLVGKTLGWFLTTSHRFLRDRTTKALVSLFTNRISILCEVLKDFVGVDDLYVSERLYAVAYGCALRTTDTLAKRTLAKLVYDLVFRNRQPPCHILLRDYARGVIEVALRDGTTIEGLDPQVVRPPYVSKWPLEIPSKKDVEHLGEWSSGMPDEQWAQNSIYNSVMGDGDFARYILGSDGGRLQWSARSLHATEPSRREQYEAFERSLTKRQRAAWDSLLRAEGSVEILQRMMKIDPSQEEIEVYSEKELQAFVRSANRAFLRTIGKEKKETFRKIIRPYLDASPNDRDEFSLPVNIAQRWIVKRVMDLGWTVERFGHFDRHEARDGDPGRSANKPERIGKKYQWIAYYEFLAHMADNLEFREDSWSEERSVYEGPWQLWRRDIDPSCLLRNTRRSNWDPNVANWWCPVRAPDWDAEADDVQWMRRTDLLPNMASLPTVIDPATGRRWLVLECFYQFEQPVPPDVDRYRMRRRHIWYMLKSYLVRASDEEAFFKWGTQQHFMGRWMPESHDESRVFLGEFFWAPAFQYFDKAYYGRDGWTRNSGTRNLPCDVLVTADGYMQERPGYDCSIDDTISMKLPCRWIANKLALSWRGREGCFFNSEGLLVAQDPSVRLPGPEALVVDQEAVEKVLAAEGYRFVWTLLGEKEVFGDSMAGNREEFVGRMELSGCMRTTITGIEGLATAYWVTRGPMRETLGTIKI